MPTFSLTDLSLVFVSDASMSKPIGRAVERGELRKLASPLNTRDLKEDPEWLIRRNWYHLIHAFFPDALIADRTALENKPAEDGSVFLISDKKRDIELPGLTFRPRKGPRPLDSDKPFVWGCPAVIDSARLSGEYARLVRAMAMLRARSPARNWKPASTP